MERLNAALAHGDAGRRAEAARLFEELAEVHPDDAAVYHHWANLFLNEGNLAQAIAKLRIATGLAEDRADIANDLGVLLHRAGEWATAEEALGRATALAPEDARYHHNLGNLFRDRGRANEAEARYRRAIQLDPGYASAHNNLGNIFKDHRRHDDALQCYERAIAADPEFAPAYKNLADLRELEGDISAAAENYAEVFKRRQDAGARIRAAMLLPTIPESQAQIVECRRRMGAQIDELRGQDIRVSDPIREVGGTPFLTAYHGCNDRDLHTALAELFLEGCPELGFVAPHCSAWRGPGQKIRVGFASAFFRDHTIAKLNRGLIAHLPRDAFEVQVFSLAAPEDQTTNAIRQSADGFAILPADLSVARQTIAAAELDILYYTDIGMEPLSYFLGFARLAPVQCVAWGHPDTTGIPAIDYFVSSQMVEPDDGDAAYSEKLIRLAPLPNYVDWPRVAKPVERADFGLADDVRYFLCPQSLFKFHPSFDKILGRILRDDRRRELLLLQGSFRQWAERLRARFRETIPDVLDQIRFLPRLSSDRFGDLLAVVDVILDTPDFCGGITSYEALAAGTPVVTQPGAYMRSRVSAGLYRQLALEDCIASSPDDYVATAIRLAADSAFNAEVREKIAAAVPALFDNREAVDAHARFFKWAVSNPAGLPPIF